MSDPSTASGPISNEPFKSDPSQTITWSLGEAEAKLIVHAPGRATGLACTISEHIWAPGDAGGFHRHMLEDEAFYVLEGQLTVEMPDDDETFTVSAGEVLWHPKGRRHNYSVSADSRVRLLQILVPGTDLVPGFFQAIAEGKADDIGTEEGAAEFFEWSRSMYGVDFSAPEE